MSMGLYRSPAVALMPDLTPKPLRSQANAVINLMGAIGGVYSLILISLLVEREIRRTIQAVCRRGVFDGAAVVLLLLTVREKKLAAQIRQEYGEGAMERSLRSRRPLICQRIKRAAGGQEKLPADVRRSLILFCFPSFSGLRPTMR